MQIIPINPVASQILSVSLRNQPCKIAIYQKTSGLFTDLSINDIRIVAGVLSLNTVLLVRDAYLGFVGDLTFFDMQGNSDPDYTGLGSRWLLAYIETFEMY